MRNGKVCLLSTALLGFAISASAAQFVPAADSGRSTPPSGAQVDDALLDEVNVAFNVFESRIEMLEVPQLGPEESIQVTVPFEGTTYTIDAQTYSVRSVNYIVLEQVADGSLVEHPPGAIRTLRGEVRDASGAAVGMMAGSRLETGLLADIQLYDGGEFWIEPLATKMPGTPAGWHAIFRDSDVLDSGGTCATELQGNDHDDGLAARTALGGLACGTGLCFAELANDADVEYFQDYGSVEAVENRINDVVNTMNIEYENDVQITHVISAIVVRTSEPDPYTSSNSGTLVNQLRNEWETNLDDIPRDITQLFSGKNFDGSIIGQAFNIGVVCTDQAYSVSQSDCCGAFACTTDLHAHENGHVWNGIHCSPCGTMNTPLSCANFFSDFSQGRISSHRDSRSCLGTGGGGALPFFDEFPSTTINANLWSQVSNASSNTDGNGEPSAPNSLNITGNGTVVSQPMDLSGLQDGGELSYWWQRTGSGNSPEPGENLVVEYLNNLNNWVSLISHPGDGPDADPFTREAFVLPADAMHPFFRIRFRNTSSNTGSDDWFVDDVAVNGFEPGVTTTPLFDLYSDLTLDTQLWTGISGASTSTRGQNEPSPTRSLNLNGDFAGGDQLRSAIMDTSAISDLTVSYWYQAGGTDDPPDLGDDLIIEYLNNSLQWVEINRHFGNGSGLPDYTFVSLPMPADAQHTDFRLRLRVTSDLVPPAADDDWFVDNVCVGAEAFCLDPFECSVAMQCDDGIDCTTDDCVDGFCTSTESDAACDDGVGCTADACDAALGCINTTDDSMCDDGVSCTVDVCDSAAGCQAVPNDSFCDDSNSCTTDTCDALNGCEFTPIPDCSGVQGVIAEDATDAGAQALGLAVCNLYVQFGSLSDEMLSVGFSSISTTDPAGFHQDPLGSDTAPGQIFIDVFPELAYDSYVDIGLKVIPEGGSDATSLDPDWDSSLFNSGGGAVGGWFNSNPTNTQGIPDGTGRVFIAQFSVNEGFSVSGTMSVFFNDGLEEVPVAFECAAAMNCPTCPDFNGDGDVDASDLALLLGAWGNPGCGGASPCCQDIDGDGDVDASDLAQLLGAWGPCS